MDFCGHNDRLRCCVCFAIRLTTGIDRTSFGPLSTALTWYTRHGSQKLGSLPTIPAYLWEYKDAVLYVTRAHAYQHTELYYTPCK